VDVDRLRVLRRLTAQGYPIGQLARLSLEELEQLADADLPSPTTSEAGAVRSSQADEFSSAAVRAARKLEAGDLKAVLEQAAIALGVPAFLDQVVAPAIREIGHGWEQGTLSVGQEHLATAVFRQVLSWIIETFQVSHPAARLLVATPPGEAHELGALMAGAAAGIEGWDVVHLGADLPAADIVAAAHQMGADAVALSLVHTSNIPRVIEDLKNLRQAMGEEVRLLMGGSAATQQRERLEALGAQVFDSFAGFREALRSIAASKPSPVQSQ
jgi:methanogenic corrinoid protein MtbC1